MSIKYKIENTDKYLLVTSEGEDDNLQEVMEYAKAIITSAVENKSPLLLCDERLLRYKLNTFDTYELAKFASCHGSELSKFALVTSEANLKDAHFYETVTINRGLTVRVFTNLAEAENWLA